MTPDGRKRLRDEATTHAATYGLLCEKFSSLTILSLLDQLEAVERERDDLQLQVDAHNDASTPAFDEIAKLCGCPEWEYPGQVVRDVQNVVKALRAALATWCPHDPGGDGADGETYALCKKALGEAR